MRCVRFGIFCVALVAAPVPTFCNDWSESAEIDFCGLALPDQCASQYDCCHSQNGDYFSVKYDGAIGGCGSENTGMGELPPAAKKGGYSQSFDTTASSRALLHRGEIPVFQLADGSVLRNMAKGVCTNAATKLNVFSRFRDVVPTVTVAETATLWATAPDRAKITGLVKVRREPEWAGVYTCAFKSNADQASLRKMLQPYESQCERSEWSPSYRGGAIRPSSHHRHAMYLKILVSTTGESWSVAGTERCVLGLGELENQDCVVEASVSSGSAVKLTVELERTAADGPGGPHNWGVQVVQTPMLFAETCYPDYLNAGGCL